MTVLTPTYLAQDRYALLFDTVCTITDAGYDIFHGHVEISAGVAKQQYWVHHHEGATRETRLEQSYLEAQLVDAVQVGASSPLPSRCTPGAPRA